MFTNDGLRSMDRAECVGRVAEIDERLAELTTKHRQSRSDEAEIRELQDEREQVDTHRRRLDLKNRFASPEGRADLASGRVKTIPGSGGHDDDSAREQKGSRERALKALDSSVRDGTMPADAATTFERLLGTGSQAERNWMADYVSAAGSPDYLSAFAKKLADPEGARDRFNAAEVEAVRRVHQVAEARAMTLTDAQGGMMIPAHLDPAILLSSDGFRNPIREMARVVQIAGDVWHGVSSAGASANFAAEGDEANDDSPSLSQPTIPVHKGHSFVPYSVEVEGDAAGFVTEVSRVMIEAIDELWSEKFVLGSGISEPTGFITALVAAGGSIIVPGDGSEALDNNDPIKLQNALPPRAQGNSAFAANLSTINALRIAETSNGALLYPSLQNDVPTLLGRRIYEISEMDGTVNGGATEANYLLALGDWSRFVIVDRVGTRVELVPHLFGPNRRPTGQRGFYAWFRTGSSVVTANSFRLLNVPTTA